MRKYILIRFFLPVFTILLTSFVITLPAQAAAFAKFDGIDGEATYKEHKNWIEILSITEGISSSVGGTVGSGRASGQAVFQDIVLVHFLDKTSVLLRQNLAQGKVIPKLEIELTASYADKGQQTYFRYELRNVIITSLSLSAGGGEERAVEEIAVNYETIEWTYTELDSKGDKQGTTQAGYDIQKGGAL